MAQPLEVPATMRFEALPHLSYSKFRLHRQTFSADNSVAGAPLQQGQTATVSCSAPSNWYLLGNRSKICWESVLSGGADRSEVGAVRTGESYRRMRYGPNAAFSRVQESLNSGSLSVSRIDEASQSIGRSRAFLSRRSIQHLYQQIGTSRSGVGSLSGVGTTPPELGSGWVVGDRLRIDKRGSEGTSPNYATGFVSAEVAGVPSAVTIISPGYAFNELDDVTCTRLESVNPDTAFFAVVATTTANTDVIDLSLVPSECIINSLEASGCVNRGLRAKCTASLEETHAFNGFPYSVPLTAYSRVAQNDFVPVGLMSQFNPASAWQFEFTVAEAVNAGAAPLAGGSPPSAAATNHQVYDLRLEAYFVELLDSRIQEAIVAQFNREVVQTPEGPIELKLELPTLGMSHQVYQLPVGSNRSMISIQSNSSSLRGICIIPRGKPGATDDGALDFVGLRWNSVLVTAGGYCVMGRPADEEHNNRPLSLDNWLTAQREDAASLFSLYAPQRDAVVGDSASQLLGLQGQADSTIGSICLNFENADGDEIDHLRAARGLDLRNVGRVDVRLSYEQNQINSADQPLVETVDVDVLLVEDVLYNIGRSGVRDVSTYEFGV